MGHRRGFTGESVPCGRTRGSAVDVQRGQDRRDHVCAGRTIWELAAWGSNGCCESRDGILVRYFAVALASRGITVNTISPGWVEDSVLNSLPEAFQTGVREWQERGWTPMGRLGTPSDIGNAVEMICSEEAGWITGQLI